MNKILTLILASLLFVAGCGDESLDTSPNDRYTEESFWTSEKNASAGLTGCYAVLRNTALYGGAAPLWEETATPNAYNYDNSLGYGVIALGTHTNTNSTVINNRWGACYSGIGRCNTLLANIDKVIMDNTLKERMKAEARFLRALYYSILETYYGDAPLILAQPSMEHAYLPKNARTEIVEQVILDLDEAAAILPLKYTAAADIGRATKGAALALKARVLLFEASPLNNPANDLTKWDNAAKAAKAVMDLSGTGYDLYPNYRQLFLPVAENKQETVFDVQFKTPELGSSYDLIGRQFNTNAPLKGLVRDYEMKDGLPQSASPLYDPTKPYENLDPRFYQTVVFPTDTFRGTKVEAGTFAFTGYALKKYTVYDKEANSNLIGDGRSEINYMVIRYADVLLMYAEAQNEAVGPDASVYEVVNRIRERAGFDNFEIPPGKTQEEMREIIRHERRIEFAGEGFYYNDIRRWKTAETVMQGLVYKHNDQPAANNEREFDPALHYWWPIPQVQLDLNPNLQ